MRRLHQRHRQIQQCLRRVKVNLQVRPARVRAGHLQEVLGDGIISQRQQRIECLPIVALLPPPQHLFQVHLAHVDYVVHLLLAVTEHGVELGHGVGWRGHGRAGVRGLRLVTTRYGGRVVARMDCILIYVLVH